MPKVSVIMSCYNSEKYIADCISSVLKQTFSDFEFIIIDDNSTDESLNIIESFDDNRIILIKNNTNVGLTQNLNKGIEISKGEYIARIDSDDVCFPDRFQTQIDFLEKNDDISVVGSNAIMIDEYNKIVGITDETLKPDDIRNKCYLQNPLLHPSVMMRKQFISTNKYNELFKTCQDFELWVRTNKTYRFANIKKPLVFYRLNKMGATRSAKNNIEKRISIISSILREEEFLSGVNEEDLEILVSISWNKKVADVEKCWNIYNKISKNDIDKQFSLNLLMYFGFWFLVLKNRLDIAIGGLAKRLRFYIRIIFVRLFFSHKYSNMLRKDKN